MSRPAPSDSKMIRIIIQGTSFEAAKCQLPLII